MREDKKLLITERKNIELVIKENKLKLREIKKKIKDIEIEIREDKLYEYKCPKCGCVMWNINKKKHLCAKKYR